MDSIKRFMLNSKTLIVMVGSAGIWVITTLSGFLGNLDGLHMGEAASIMVGMYWVYMLEFVIVLSILANLPWIGSRIKYIWKSFAERYDNSMAFQVSYKSRMLTRLSYMLQLGCILFLILLIIINVSFLISTQVRYLFELNKIDFRNRELILAREYFQLYRLKDAARIYSAIKRDGGQSSIVDERLQQIERRYRLHKLGISLDHDRDRDRPLGPDDAYRSVTIALLNPRSADPNTNLAEFLSAARDSKAALRRIRLLCTQTNAASIPAKTYEKDLYRLLDYTLYQAAGRQNKPALRWYCDALARDALNEDAIDERWQVKDVRRTLALRSNQPIPDFQCSENGELVPIDDEPVVNETPNAQVNEIAAKEPEVAEELPDETLGISRYAAGIYHCVGAGKNPWHTRLLRLFVPWAG